MNATDIRLRKQRQHERLLKINKYFGAIEQDRYSCKVFNLKKSYRAFFVLLKEYPCLIQ